MSRKRRFTRRFYAGGLPRRGDAAGTCPAEALERAVGEDAAPPVRGPGARDVLLPKPWIWRRSQPTITSTGLPVALAMLCAEAIAPPTRPP